MAKYNLENLTQTATQLAETGSIKNEHIPFLIQDLRTKIAELKISCKFSSFDFKKGETTNCIYFKAFSRSIRSVYSYTMVIVPKDAQCPVVHESSNLRCHT